MKTPYTIAAFFMVMGGLVIYSPSYTNQGGAPAGRTNAPGERTCNTSGCHAGSDVNAGPGSLSVQLLKDGSEVSMYEAGETYTLRLELTDQNMNAAGFEVTALDSTNEKAGNLVAEGNVQELVGQSNRQYLTHTSPFTSFDANTQTWELEWNAPSSLQGELTFYAAGNAANGNGGRTGDLIYNANSSIQPDQATGLGDQSVAEQVQVYPNPAKDNLNVQLPSDMQGAVNLQLVGMQGKFLKDFGEVGNGGANTVQLSIPQNLAPGVYMLRISGNQQNTSKTVLIQ